MPMFFGCDVIRVGPARQERIDLELRQDGGGFPQTWFAASDDFRREMLAVALTALSSDYKVDVELDSIEQGSVVHTMYLSSD